MLWGEVMELSMIEVWEEAEMNQCMLRLYVARSDVEKLWMELVKESLLLLRHQVIAQPNNYAQVSPSNNSKKFTEPNTETIYLSASSSSYIT